MQLSKFSYYSDFVVYPVVITVLVAANIPHSTWHSGREWAFAVAGGLVLWTLMEYALHRIALHRMAIFSPMHAEHHGAPLALIATPSWISVTVWSGAILLPGWLTLGFNLADGLTVGVMVGYWWYGIVHHVIHHRPNKAARSYFNGLRAWHMRHHYSPKRGNFGVTTSFWDRVFRTVIKTRDKSMASS